MLPPATEITDIKISDPKQQQLVATAASGQLSSGPGAPSSVIATSVVNEPGQTLELNKLYTIAATGMTPQSNMQYNDYEPEQDVYIFIQVK